jgi:uncharacterized membrane protein YbhN (UPF0104 family)
MTKTRWFRLTTRAVVGGAVLIAVVAHVGTGPFVRGLLNLDIPSIVVATLLAFTATAAAAWRWRVIAGRLGVELSWSSAITMYYRSVFLNMVLPGGVTGDMHRAISHGRSVESVAQASRAVAIERGSGQVVQLALALVVLATIGAQFEGYLITVLAIGMVAIVVVLAALAASRRVRKIARHELNELRTGLGSPVAAVQVTIASVVVVGCHVATFAVATAALGESMPPLRLLTLAVVILLGASIPLNIGGWGPREGIAGWAFALAGFGAAAGVAASTLFGVLSFIAIVPGVIVTVIAARRRRSAMPPTHTAQGEGEGDGEADRTSPKQPALQPITVSTQQQREETS